MMRLIRGCSLPAVLAPLLTASCFACAFYYIQWVFAGTVATIVSGAVAERCRFRAYLIYSAYLSGYVYSRV